MNNKLSIIIPFVYEFPQSLFTIQSIAQSLIGKIDFEIIAINNYCDEVEEQGRVATINSVMKNIDKLRTISFQKDISELNKKAEIDKIHDVLSSVMKNCKFIFKDDNGMDSSGNSIKACARINPWLKYVEFKDRLSHWEAKRVGIANAEGDTFLFADAHTVPSGDAIADMFEHYNGPIVDESGVFDMSKKYNEQGSMHLPLTYKILESHRLIYKMAVEDGGFHGYSFTRFRYEDFPYEVPCMSTCGMMISREIYDKIGGWPEHMSAYGGGENYMNYTLAVCGFKKWIFPNGTLFHHGDKRDYHWTYDGMLKNRMIAHYLFGGKLILERWVKHLTENGKGRPETLRMFADEVYQQQHDHRQKIKAIQVINIDEWVKTWKDK